MAKVSFFAGGKPSGNFAVKSPSGKSGFFSGLGKAAKATGRGIHKTAKYTDKILTGAGKHVSAAGRATEATAKKVYVGGHKINVEHRRRVIAKETYKLQRLQLKGSQAEARQLIPPRESRSIRPLGDKQFGINPSKRLNAGVVKRKGPGPLSDKNFSKKRKEMLSGDES